MMSTITLSVDEAARDLPGVIRRIFNQGEHVVLTEGGRPIVEIVPLAFARSGKTGAELVSTWANRVKLPKDEAENFARDIEESRQSLNRPPESPAWE